MSQERPLTHGKVTGGHTIKAGQARFPTAKTSRNRGSIIHTADSDFSTGDWTLVAANADWTGNGGIQHLPIALLYRPLLIRAGVIHWDVTGNFFNDPFNANGGPPVTIDWELLVDGVTVGSTLTWVESGVVDAAGMFIFSADLYIVEGTQPSTPTRYVLDARFRIIDGAGTVMVDSMKTIIPVIDPTADSRVKWRMRKTAGTLTRLAAKSVGCVQLVHTLGGSIE